MPCDKLELRDSLVGLQIKWFTGIPGAKRDAFNDFPWLQIFLQTKQNAEGVNNYIDLSCKSFYKTRGNKSIVLCVMLNQEWGAVVYRGPLDR